MRPDRGAKHLSSSQARASRNKGGTRKSKPSDAHGNLRAFVILVVLAFHSVLAYLDALPASAYRFDSPGYEWQTYPIVDSQRWQPFDLFCAWHDVYLMSLMFFLSGLFVWPSLTRKQAWTYSWDRCLRLGLPFALAVFVLMPLALYPTYRVTAPDPGVAAYWREFIALPFWPCGPQWFLWQLLALNILAAGLYKLVPGWGGVLDRLVAATRADPTRFFVVLAAASAIAYVPLAQAFTPWSWTQFGPFALQESRPLHYAVYFFAGVGVGSGGLDRGLLAVDGLLARRWAVWLAVAFATFMLWIGPTALIMTGEEPAPFALQLVADLGFVLACAGGGMFALAICLRFATNVSPVLDSLSDNAYGMYLVHYGFVIWLQYALLGVALHATVKAAIVFAGTLALSWAATAALRAVPFGSRLIGTERRVLAKAR
ncbi:MAG: hypothetical protein QOC56_1076 [Alphaproteobacteria bacterium]|nr:hypothetical protein [Alphaproteobacteria bacterium]